VALQHALFLPAEFGEAAFEGFTIIAAVALGIAGWTDRSSRGSGYGISPAPIRLRRRISALSIPRSRAASSISRSQKNEPS
jgi:hypothetical protein